MEKNLISSPTKALRNVTTVTLALPTVTSVAYCRTLFDKV
jgi:hypothetical protein